MGMKLQIALDFDFDFLKAKSIIQETINNIDIIEAGTPFLMEQGLCLLSKLKKSFPEKKLVADLKIADAGYREAENAFKAGADAVTTLAAVGDTTVKNVKDAARAYDKKIIVDMLGVENLKSRLKEIDDLSVDYICLHTSKDLQKLNEDFSQAFMDLKNIIKNSKVIIAGNINVNNIKHYAEVQPDIIIVGEGITLSSNPYKTSSEIRSAMNKYN